MGALTADEQRDARRPPICGPTCQPWNILIIWRPITLEPGRAEQKLTLHFPSTHRWAFRLELHCLSSLYLSTQLAALLIWVKKQWNKVFGNALEKESRGYQSLIKYDSGLIWVAFTHGLFYLTTTWEITEEQIVSCAQTAHSNIYYQQLHMQCSYSSLITETFPFPIPWTQIFGVCVVNLWLSARGLMHRNKAGLKQRDYWWTFCVIVFHMRWKSSNKWSAKTLPHFQNLWSRIRPSCFGLNSWLTAFLKT